MCANKRIDFKFEKVGVILTNGLVERVLRNIGST